MKISAIINGSACQIVDIQRNGSQAYVTYINGSGNGPLVSTVFSTSAFGVPDIVLSTSATYLL